MPIQSINFHNVAPIDKYYDSGPDYENILASILRGYKMSRIPAELRAEEEKNLLSNRLKEEEVRHAPEFYGNRNKAQRLLNEEREFSNLLQRKHGPEEKELELERMRAQIEREKALAKMGGGRYAPSNIEKLRIERENAIDNYGEDSQEVKNIDAYIEKITNQGLTGAVRTRQQTGDIAALELEQLDKYPVPQRYLGAPSDVNLAKDMAVYVATKDPIEKERLKDDLSELVAVWKQTMETAGIQLRALGIPATVHALENQASIINAGFPRFSKRAINNLPSDVLKEGNRKFKERLKVLNKARSSYKPNKGNDVIDENEVVSEALVAPKDFRGMSNEELKDWIAAQEGAR